MSQRKRGNSWQVRFQVNGKIFEESLGPTATKQDAKDYEAKRRREIICGKVGRKKKYTIEDALVRWLQGEASTLASYKDGSLLSKIRLIKPFVINTQLTSIVEAAEAIKSSGLKEGLLPATINRRLAVLRRIANLAYQQWQWLDKPYGNRIKLLKGEIARHVYLTPKQVESLAKNCRHPVVATAIKLVARTGLRKSELLKADTIYDGCIVVEGKGNPPRPRLVPVPAEMSDLKLPLGISDSVLREYFEEARALSGLEYVRFHDLRHTAASWWAMANANMGTIGELLGHTNANTTRRYTHFSTSHLKEVTNRVPIKEK